MEKKFPRSLMAVEKKVAVNGLPQRFDLLAYDRKGNPLLVAEFKAPGIPVTQKVFDQALRYNATLKAPFFLISNGLDHFICQVDYLKQQTSYIREIPSYDEIALISNDQLR